MIERAERADKSCESEIAVCFRPDSSGKTMEDAALLPTRSPLLMAAGRHQAVHARRANSDNYLSLISSNEDVLEDIDQLDSGSSWKEHREDSDDLDEDEDDIEDFSLEDGHIDGIPSAGMRFDAKSVPPLPPHTS